MDGRGGVLSVAQYGRAEGVPGTDGTDGNQPLSWLAKDGRLWFATVDGVVIFDPTEVADTPAAPAVSIDTVQVNKARVELSALVSPLPARSIDIVYSAPRLMGGRAVQYEYRLVGLDDAWVDAGAARTASFTNLSPGDYHFEVRARARRGAPAGTVRTLRFQVPARFYQTGWFLGLSLTAITLVIAGLVRWRVGHLRRHQQVLQRLVEERTAALRHEMLERERAERERRALDVESSRRSASKASACWPAAWRTTSTTCSSASSARPASRSRICRRARRGASTSSTSSARPCGPANSRRRCSPTRDEAASSWCRSRSRISSRRCASCSGRSSRRTSASATISRDGCRWSRPIRRSCGRS